MPVSNRTGRGCPGCELISIVVPVGSHEQDRNIGKRTEEIIDQPVVRERAVAVRTGRAENDQIVLAGPNLPQYLIARLTAAQGSDSADP